MARQTLMTKVRRLLESRFPGSDVKLERATPSSKVVGTLIWAGFTGRDQIERQRAVREVIRGELSVADQLALSAILTITPTELEVMRAG